MPDCQTASGLVALYQIHSPEIRLPFAVISFKLIQFNFPVYEIQFPVYEIQFPVFDFNKIKNKINFNISNRFI